MIGPVLMLCSVLLLGLAAALAITMDRRAADQLDAYIEEATP